MPAISNLGYFVIGVSDLEAWRHFAADIIGMQAVPRGDGLLALRMDERSQRILLQASGEDDMLAVGWEFATEEDLEAFAERSRSTGYALQAGSPELARLRRVQRLYHGTDPNGITHEFYFGAESAGIADPFRSSVMRGGFVTGALGVGHYVALARDAQETHDFYRRQLGLRVSDHVRQDLGPGLVMNTTFLHTRTGRHHSVAMVKHPLPVSTRRIHHIMAEVADLNDVGMAYDRCLRAGLTMEMTLGHHPNDGMTSFYVRTPSGFSLEFGWGGLVVDDETWTVKSYVGNSDWGHVKSSAPKEAKS